MLFAEPLRSGLEPFPGYCLTRRLGSGGFGEVWKAQTAESRSVALKFMPSGSAVRELRSLQEIRQLCHPHLLRIERVWCFEGYIVIGMELAEGSLLELLEISRAQFGNAMGRTNSCQLLSQAASALDFLNTRQHHINGRCVAIQHCDVKPSNLLLCGDTLKLADFGLSSLLGSQHESRRRAGTLEFCAPEVFQSQISSQTDQYALAVTYCLLRGKLPFANTPKSFDASYIRPTPDLSMLTQAERPIVVRALSPIPQNRWSSCGELMSRLTQLVLPTSPTEPQKSMRIG